MLNRNPFTIGFVGGNNYQPSAPLIRPAKKKDIDHNYQIFVTGDKEAGKTALIMSLMEPTSGHGKYTITYGYKSGTVQMGDQSFYLRINDVDAREYRHQQHLEKTKFDANVAFIVVKLKKKRSSQELELFIQKQCQEIRKLAPDCKVVLVASKSDKANFPTSAEILKSVALKLNCLGAALVNHSVENVQRLFQATIETLAAEKQARLAPPPVNSPEALLRSLNYLGSTLVDNSLNDIRRLQQAAAPGAQPLAPVQAAPQLSAAQQEAIASIQRYVDILVEELCSFWSANRKRKLVKIDAFKELILLIQFDPAKPIAQHIEAIKEKYAGKEFEIGSRTVSLLEELVSAQAGQRLRNS